MSENQQTAAPRPRRVLKLRWIAVGAFVALVLVLLFTPPLVNANRWKKRIVTSMSSSLGRPVHIDDVQLNLLPVPGFTLRNVVVSEDPGFGFEPVIRAERVKANIRVSSLWRQQVEFGTVTFDSPSVNLVRRADGRWNLESILLHASQENAAPTAQPKAGPAPRFPYIEATGARVNVKLGDEKLPIALTETDFALWLPSPEEWRVRLEAKPTRTNSGASDTGLIRAEVTLRRAARLQDVPIEMTASWSKLPLGEATRVLTRSDAGWRGAVEASVTLHGTLSDAVLNGNLKVGGLRRAEFIPAHPMDLSMECSAHMAVATAVLREPACTLSPTPITHMGFGVVASAPQSAIYANADRLDLTGLKVSGLRVGSPNVSLAWLANFAHLWSQGTPQFETPKGSASGSFALEDSGWQGEFHGSMTVKSLDAPKGEPSERPFSISAEGSQFTLAPYNLTYAERTPLLFSATASRANMTLRLTGSGTPHQVLFLGTILPPLTDGFRQALPPLGGDAEMKVDLTCTRSWGAEQTCVAAKAAEPVRPRGRRR